MCCRICIEDQTVLKNVNLVVSDIRLLEFPMRLLSLQAKNCQDMYYKADSSLKRFSRISQLLENRIKQSTFQAVLQKNATDVKDKAMMIPKRTRYLIYRCTGGVGAVFCSGWGNRLIGIQSTYFLAKATERTFGIIMTHPCALTEIFTPNEYNWDFSLSMFQNMSSIYLSLRDKKDFTYGLTTLDFNAKYPQDVVYIVTNHNYLSQLQSNKLYKDKVPSKSNGALFTKVYQSLFKLRPSVQEELDSFLRKAKPNPKTNLTCAQIRVGKNPSVRWDSRGTMSDKSLNKIWEFLNETQTDSNIFVTTDSEKVRQLAKTYYGKRIFDTEGPIMHLDKPYGVRKLCGGLRKLILDQYILVICDKLIVSPSSFTRMPLMMRGTKNCFTLKGDVIKQI
ncbi:uncharacterized protein LOC106881636 isoform X2 [Octopus bimaculoides]|uniref:uncharacterized protein LOC106881636 isoform X2 n=2 Tax=Octopus bimaculoides TaxID=37653 RepID=UPI0022DF1A7B|nr:uncharacterized protein LOC106881636 isoform X2 [Octopus bimaculoides]